MTAWTLSSAGNVGDSGAGAPVLTWGATRPTTASYVAGVDSNYPWAWAPGSVAASAAGLVEGNKIRVWGSGTVRRLGLVLGTASAVADITTTLQVNGVDSALTCTLAQGGTVASDTTHTVSVTDGDLLDVRLAATATENTALGIYICAEQV